MKKLAIALIIGIIIVVGGVGAIIHYDNDKIVYDGKTANEIKAMSDDEYYEFLTAPHYFKITANGKKWEKVTQSEVENADPNSKAEYIRVEPKVETSTTPFEE